MGNIRYYFTTWNLSIVHYDSVQWVLFGSWACKGTIYHHLVSNIYMNFTETCISTWSTWYLYATCKWNMWFLIYLCIHYSCNMADTNITYLCVLYIQYYDSTHVFLFYALLSRFNLVGSKPKFWDEFQVYRRRTTTDQRPLFSGWDKQQ